MQLIFRMLLLGVALIVSAPTLEAQSLADRLKAKAKERMDQRTDQALDKAVDRADQAVTCVVTDRACIEKAEKEGQAVRVTDRSGKVVEERAAADPARARTGDVATARPGEGAWSNYDFVPGARVLFAEDFTRDRVGNFPRRLELLNGNMEVVEWQGRRWLRSTGSSAFKLSLPETLPERFTIEFDLTLPWIRMAFYSDEFQDAGGVPMYSSPSAVVQLSGIEAGIWRAGGAAQSAVDPRILMPNLNDEYENSFLSKPLRVRMQVDGRYVKLYLNEHRISNMPNADFGRRNHVIFEFGDNSNGGDPYPPLITDISVNAGGMDLYDALAADGRVATRGILFDTGSDRLRPESTPTLREIVDMLNEHADLSLTIEGHTDDVGNAAANQTLSEKRAAAVKAYLVAQGIAAARLESQGLGSTKPAVAGTTPEARQQNRRVELVKR
ncbi:MAG TPA: OmpA family protein [Gemmatimonadaceae bacterium]|jgi:outer membrane protein OmpA-like peptidoglycan-associated protein|nr:OmpA family protein [Gemmatimonadaceae bacterium]